jgi:hypothetical protein
VEGPYPIPALVNLKVSHWPTGAFMNLKLTCWKIQTGLRDVIPLFQIGGGLRVVNLNREVDVSSIAVRLDNDDMRTNFDAFVNVLLGILFGSERIHTFVPKIELVVVRKDFDRALL